ncbi:MAG TPA: metal ABC transporter substrate-binding protein [Candidatus Hypogeohydataceae bacterium YC38]|nr:metal ABC transporter substrate-binding protein [Candidatus Brocadiales bacterium]
MERLLKGFFCVTVFFWLVTLQKDAQAKVKVVTTSTDLASISQLVGGEKIEAESIIRGYQNPHYVDIKPSYMIKLHKADMFVKVGLDLELWAPVLAEGARNSRILFGAPGYVDASLNTEILEIPQVRVTRALGDIHIFGNPHYWLDPLNGKVIAENILAGLKRVDPQDAAYFEKNKEDFDKKIDEYLPGWLERMRPYAGTKVVTYHNSWPNFIRRFGLVVVDYVEPKPGVPPSPSHVSSLIEKMRSEGVKILIQEPFYETKVSSFVAEKTDAKLVILSPSVLGEEGAVDYFSLFDRALDKLLSAFLEVGIKPQS